MKLAGKVAAITGGTAGMGRGIAEAFLAEGAKVALFARNPEKGAKVLEELGAGENAIFIAGDVMSQSDLEGFVDQVVAHETGFVEVEIQLGKQALHGFQLIRHALKEQVDFQVLHALFNTGRLAAGENGYLDSGALQQVQSGTIQGVERFHFSAVVGVVKRAVREHAVDIKGHQLEAACARFCLVE